MPRELEMETVTIYCLQSHSGDIFIVLSWAESRAPVAPGIMTLVATWPGQATGQGRLYATYCHIFIISWFGKIIPVYTICQLVLIFIFLKNMRVIKTRPGPGSPRCCWWQCRCGAVRWWEVMQGSVQCPVFPPSPGLCKHVAMCWDPGQRRHWPLVASLSARMLNTTAQPPQVTNQVNTNGSKDQRTAMTAHQGCLHPPPRLGPDLLLGL